MNGFDNEVKQRWGDTAAYQEYEQKGGVSDAATAGLMAIFGEFALCKNSGASADSTEAQALVAKLRAHITANYYTCTDEILAGLGKMYVSDERFKKNIDKYGEGTAEFVAEAIEIYFRGK